MYKNVNFLAATAASVIGSATKARVRVQDGSVQVRFTDRTSTVNMPKTEQLRNLGVKGSGRRLGLPSEIASNLPEAGTALALVPGKYGWFTLAALTDGATKAASVSA
jgi:hypothetical protein